MADEKPQEKHKIKKKETAMKQIEKLILSFLFILTSMFSFGCGKTDDSYQYKFFSQEALEWHWISDLPSLSYKSDVRWTGGTINSTFYCTLEENNYLEYTETIYKYLKEKFQYISCKSMDDVAGWSFPFVEGKELADFMTETKDDTGGKITTATFVYGNEIFQPFQTEMDCLNWRGVKIYYYERANTTTRWEDFTFNTAITLFWGVHSCVM